MHCVANGIPVKRIDGDALSAFEEHTWPGNVRELENLMQRLIVTVRGDQIGLRDLPPRVLAQSVTAQEAILLPSEGVDFDQEVSRLEVALLTTALNGRRKWLFAAAQLLKIDGQRIKYLCRKYSL